MKLMSWRSRRRPIECPFDSMEAAAMCSGPRFNFSTVDESDFMLAVLSQVTSSG
jgi:hypothetical protein